METSKKVIAATVAVVIVAIGVAMIIAIGLLAEAIDGKRTHNIVELFFIGCGATMLVIAVWIILRVAFMEVYEKMLKSLQE